MHLLLISTTCSDLCRMTTICEYEMKRLDTCFKMAVSANRVITDLVMSRLETKKKKTVIFTTHVVANTCYIFTYDNLIKLNENLTKQK